MEAKDKAVLVREILQRAPYGVFVYYNGLMGKVHHISVYPIYEGDEIVNYYAAIDFFGDGEYIDIEEFKLVLRDMNDMTAEEQEEYDFLLNDGGWGMAASGCNAVIQFLLKNGFDFNGLLEKGLAVKEENI